MIYIDLGYLTSCAYHRLYLPFKYMEDLPLTTDIKKASVIVFNRLPSFDMLHYKRMGVKLVMDIDDYWHLYPEHYIFRHWNPKRYEIALSRADLVTCTTEILADKIRLINKNVEVIPNALPFGSDQFIGVKSQLTGNFGYVGGNSHNLDIKLVPDITIPDQVNISKYMSLYKDLNLSFAPLIDNTFNRCKSNLKALESGVNYCALMASKIPPYFNKKDKDCVIYCDDNEWQDKIKYCKENPNYVSDMGDKLGLHVREHYDIFKVNEKRAQILNSLL